MDIPFHPQTVHFPVALLTVGLVFDIIGAVKKSDRWIFFGGLLIVLGLLFSFLALQSGQLAEDEIKPLSELLHEKVEEHEDTATISFFMILAVTVLRYFLVSKQKLDAWRHWIVIVLSTISISLLLWASHLGGVLVYEYGAGVNSSVETTPVK